MDILLVFLGLCLFAAANAIYCQRGGYSLGPSLYCFKAFKTKMTFVDAKRRCEQDGALLSKTDDDFNFVEKLMNRNSPKPRKGSIFRGYWVGAQRDSSDRFRWMDGTRVDPPSGKNGHWSEGEPNNYFWTWSFGNEDCMMTYNGWKAWNDVRCSIDLRFLCQMDSVDPCQYSQCENGAVCSSKDRRIICSCAPGFSGDRCEKDERPCARSPCQNAGRCRNVLLTGDSDFAAECLCSEEYEGERCEKKKDPCAKVVCDNGGECVAAGLKWSCSCPVGFTGSLCETNLRPCALQPCKNGGICENMGNNFKCFCHPGFQGKNCEIEDGCFKAGSPCHNGGQCVVEPRTGISAIPSGYQRGTDGFYYKAFDEEKGWNEAQKTCEVDGAQLAVIWDEKTRDVVRGFMEKGWIGLTDQWEEGKWQTPDKQDAAYASWNRGEPNNVGNEDCTVQHNDRWNDLSCESRRKFICQFTPDGIPRGYGEGKDGYFYKYHGEKKNWNEAQDVCRAEGGNLAVIWDETTRDAVRDFMENGWIGLTDQWGEGTWQTPYKGSVGYANWAPNEPNDVNGEDCAHQRGSKDWNDVSCQSQQAFVCQLPKGHATCTCPSGYTGAGCENGPCAGNPCQNGGVCEELLGDYFCECTEQFSGRHCTKECPAKSKDGFPEKLDIMFLLDGSGSVGKANYKKSLAFVDKVVRKIKLGPGFGRVGYVQFAGQWKRDNRGNIVYYKQIKKSSEITFQESAKMTNLKLRKKISDDKLFRTYTRTGDGLQYVIDRFKNGARMGNPDVAKYLMVMTDGKSTGQSEKIKELSEELWKMNVTTFAIGVGKSVSNEELDYIAHGEEHRRFSVNDFAKLNDDFVQTLIQRQCYTGPCEKYRPCKNGGECVEYDDQYVCKCPFGKFTGVHCEIDCKDVMSGGFPEKMDAFFLMDGSGSIDNYDEFHRVKHLVSKVLMKMNLDGDKQRAAVIQFAGRRDEEGKWRATSDQEIGLRNSTEMGKLKLIDYVEHEAKWGGWTLTAEALEHVADLVESEARPNVDKYVFVLTDGRVSWHLKKLKEAVARLRRLGAKTVAVAIGSDVDDETLAIIADGDDNDIFKGADFEATEEKFISKFVEKRCEVTVA